MKRNKKFIRNSIILCIFAFLFIYFGNFYFSAERCLEEIMKSMYVEDYEVLGSYKIEGKWRYTLINHEKRTMFRITIDDVGPLYRCQDIAGNEIIQMEDNHSIDIRGILYNSGLPDKAVYVIYRNDERVTSVEMQHPNGNIELCNEWNGNFCIFIDENVNVYTALPHHIYDNNHELIEIIEY